MPWTAELSFRTTTPALAEHIERALRPEAAREVPRARAEVRRAGTHLEIAIAARDAGAMRAALNTYLGWVHLAAETARAASHRPPAMARTRG
jgi:tRNA threonylcarbamoyladenosine modification (KEOPS) complex  Pcc1 subunit